MDFFTDAYDLFCISLVTKLLGHIYYLVDGAPKPETLPPNVSAAVNGVAFIGTHTAQLFLGWLGDKLEKKKVYGMALLLMAICSVASGLSFGREPKSVMTRYAFSGGFGILAGGIFATVVSSIFKAKFDAPPYEVDLVGSTVPEADFG
ncbi:hypothetical protein AAHE18_13G114500 [Arachis hypogaea]|uniref:Major facilitator superfamily (MFS) profile domain-containing protein n=1 Tax=Arachis hypogaea TaxID=3818 RepID=A0A445A6R6_ARAHY|nr:probable inorganic phosphate transporter 1-7 [Arachis hypogaea]RYR22140.1 hypothetical protein Ahy_B03g067420 [Arachis hypogaea]